MSTKDKCKILYACARSWRDTIKLIYGDLDVVRYGMLLGVVLDIRSER